MIAFGTLTKQVADFLAACVKGRLDMLISGGTGTGKTTTLNVLSQFLPADERIVTIEDAAELQLHQQHVLRLESRPPNIEGRGQVTVRDLVRNSLRMRPDRIVIGEVRDGAALDMLQAMNTGHDGSLTTVHANSRATPRTDRDDGGDGRHGPAGAGHPRADSRRNRSDHPSDQAQGRQSPDHPYYRGGRGSPGEVITVQDIFRFDFSAGLDEYGRYRGTLQPTGVRPAFLELLGEAGIHVPAEAFLPVAGRPARAGADEAPMASGRLHGEPVPDRPAAGPGPEGKRVNALLPGPLLVGPVADLAVASSGGGWVTSWARWVIAGALLASLLLAVLVLAVPRSVKHQRIQQIEHFGPGRVQAPSSPSPEATVGGMIARTALAATASVVRSGRWERRTMTRLERAGSRLRAREWVLIRVGASAACGALLFTVGHVGGAVAGVVVGWVLTALYQRVRIARRTAAFAEQLPDALQLVIGWLRSGFSLPQALDCLVREAAGAGRRRVRPRAFRAPPRRGPVRRARAGGAADPER